MPRAHANDAPVSTWWYILVAGGVLVFFVVILAWAVTIYGKDELAIPRA